MENQIELLLQVCEVEVENLSGKPYATLRVKLLCREAGKDHPRNCPSEPISQFREPWPKHLVGHYLDGLEIRAISATYSDEFIGFDKAAIRDVFSAGEADAKAMLKTLRHVNRAIQKERERAGELTLALAIVAMAESLKIKQFVIQRTASGPSYCDSLWDFLPISGIARHVQYMEHEAFDALKQTANTA